MALSAISDHLNKLFLQKWTNSFMKEYLEKSHNPKKSHKNHDLSLFFALLQLKL
jgi:hypothetical protein